jgi:F0F1-type ATP synthase assembly protein I
MFAAQKTHYEQLNSVKHIMMLSAWGFTMVVVSSPDFMLGFFLLGFFLCIMRLYQEACEKRKDV